MNYNSIESTDYVSAEAQQLFKFWEDKFKDNHGGNEYEKFYKDLDTLEGIQDRRGLIQTFIIIEAYFKMNVAGLRWQYSPKFSRNINGFRISINEMLFDKKLQAILKMTTSAKQKLIKQRYIDG